MKKINSKVLCTLTYILLFSFSCKDCEPPLFSINIIGTWKESESGSIIEIKEDGSFIDLDAVIYNDDSLEELDVKYYEVFREEYVVFTAESSTVFSSSASVYGIAKNSCDKLRLSVDDGSSVYYITLFRQ